MTERYTGPLHDGLIMDGYSALRVFNEKICGLHRFAYTVAVVVGLDRIGYEKRFCFDNLSYALSFYQGWDGLTEPVIGQEGCTAIK